MQTIFQESEVLLDKAGVSLFLPKPWATVLLALGNQSRFHIHFSMLSQLNYNTEQQPQQSIWQVEHKQITLKTAIRQTLFFLPSDTHSFSQTFFFYFPQTSIFWLTYKERGNWFFPFWHSTIFFRQRRMCDHRYTRKTLESQQVECKWLTFKIIKQTKKFFLHQLDSVFSRIYWGLFILASMHLWLSMRREKLPFVLIQKSLRIFFWFFPLLSSL